MIGIRTPVKKSTRTEADLMERTEMAGPSDPSAVRRSIGDWESGKVGPKPRSPSAVKAPSAPSKIEPRVRSSQENKTAAHRTSTEVVGSPPGKPHYINRVSEAKACLSRAKTHLGNSRNLRSDIKAEVTQAVERLYQLVKDSESEKGKDRTKEVGKEGQQKQEGEMEKVEELSRKIEEHGKLLRENNSQLEKMKEILQHQNEVLEKSTYANIAAGNTKVNTHEKTTLHSVVITSKNETDTGEEVLTQIRDVINAKDGWVKVDKIRKARDRKVIVGCCTEEERGKVKERLKGASDRLVVEDIQNKDPLLILRNVLQLNSDEDVIRALKNQNKTVFSGITNTSDERMEIRFRKKTRNPHTCHIVMRVSPKIWNRMVEAESVHIDLQRIRVEDFSPLIQCSLCLGYGHGRRFCKETVMRCSHCGGPHMRTECTDWLANVAPTCCNCNRAKLDQLEHNAFSEICPIRRKWDAMARASIAYC